MTALDISQYVGILSITIIKSKRRFLLALSLRVTIIMSLVIVAGNNVIAQTLEIIKEQQRASKNNPQIKVGNSPSAIAVNEDTNKIYVANSKTGTVSVIDSNSGSGVKSIHVGETPISIAVDSDHNKIYVANQ